MITVARLNISPVKSLGLSHPDEIRIEPFGVAENRRFLLLDPDDRVVTADRNGGLLTILSAYDARAERLSLRFPGGAHVDDEVEVDGAPFAIDLWGRQLLVRPVSGPWAPAIGELIGSPVRMVRTERPGDGNDEYPVSIVSLASVDELRRHEGRPEPVDPGRFRMLLELEGCGPHEEDEWLGRDVTVGEAIVRVADHDARCVITTRNPRSGDVDFPTLKVIAGYRGSAGGGLNFGMYAEVVRPGVVRVSDAVTPS
jgi:uncharacterized protein YcbX